MKINSVWFMRKLACLFFIATALLPLTLPAQVTNVMKLTTNLGVVQGDSTIQGHEGQIEIESFSWGITAPSGVGNPSFSDFVVIKAVDRSSPTLAQFCATEKQFSEAIFYATRMNAATNAVYDSYTVRIQPVRLAGIQSVEAPAGKSGPYEALTFRFSAPPNIIWTFRTGQPGTTTTASYP